MDSIGEKYRINHGANVRTIRCAKRIKQSELANKLEITEDELCRYEDQEILSDYELTKFAEALAIPVEVIKYMPSEDNGKIQVFKDVKFTNSSVGLTQNSFTSYYNDPDSIKILKDNIELLKTENKFLKDKLSYYEK